MATRINKNVKNRRDNVKVVIRTQFARQHQFAHVQHSPIVRPILPQNKICLLLAVFLRCVHLRDEPEQLVDGCPSDHRGVFCDADHHFHRVKLVLKLLSFFETSNLHHALKDSHPERRQRRHSHRLDARHAEPFHNRLDEPFESSQHRMLSQASFLSSIHLSEVCDSLLCFAWISRNRKCVVSSEELLDSCIVVLIENFSLSVNSVILKFTFLLLFLLCLAWMGNCACHHHHDLVVHRLHVVLVHKHSLHVFFSQVEHIVECLFKLFLLLVCEIHLARFFHLLFEFLHPRHHLLLLFLILLHLLPLCRQSLQLP
ncbi:hypothetical protein BLNAU_14034 [Blattamonas nauphoetae]|uniref:Uncharacterized protein n=1 Tax=Blattamonas nauphoetae TaxID=2049346 RepID=A0ABQ9XF41_9EUKA|nr:hypothetical protein BLNAU_14034 [Blattamonas nauphoetae]